MASINKVTIIGHLGKDPETRYAASGSAICNFSVATSERWKDKTSGEQQERTEWHRCTAFSPLAEICGEYLKKGSMVYIEGKLQTRKYEKDGQDHYSTEINVREMKMLDKKPQGSENRGDDPGPRGRDKPAAKPAAAQPKQDDFDDDIPF